ncbi:unnamed protein product [Soboliphyme baturini]|uniref:Protein BCCIP homolog n=1 Tax=Soboliphyme baturini TaxID=241478 RepID=A0A183IXP4_9BILA|nr:unnamed protein product [Soboliphyme baturini]
MGLDVDVDQVTKIITTQADIGCMFKPVDGSEAGETESDDDEDEDVFGMITILDMTQNTVVSNQMRSSLLDKCKRSNLTADNKAKFASVFSGDNRVALLINERFIGIPPKIALPAFECLKKELLTKSPSFTHFLSILLISKAEPLETGQKRRHKKEDGDDNSETVFLHPEAKFLQEVSHVTFDYEVDMKLEEEELHSFRRVIVLESCDLETFVESLKNNFENS